MLRIMLRGGKVKSNERLKIGLDLDGVLAAFSPKFVEMANEMFGYSLKAENQTEWDHTCLGLSKKEEDAVWEVINTTPNWWYHELPALPETNLITEVARRHTVYFITNRNQTKVGMSIEEQSAHWVRRNFWIPNPTVIVTKQKGKVADALLLDYFIDDKLENCLDVAKHSNTTVYLHDAPYNSDNRGHRTTPNVNTFLKELGAFSGSIKRAA